MSRIHVVAAVIYNLEHDAILIAKRPKHLHQGGLWEFPGGKVEINEMPVDALARELKEELGIQVTKSQQLLAVSHEYPDKSVYLDVWQVNLFVGEARGMEGQEVRWVARSALSTFEFPEANLPIIDKLLSESSQH